MTASQTHQKLREAAARVLDVLGSTRPGTAVRALDALQEALTADLLDTTAPPIPGADNRLDVVAELISAGFTITGPSGGAALKRRGDDYAVHRAVTAGNHAGNRMLVARSQDPSEAAESFLYEVGRAWSVANTDEPLPY